MCDTIEPAQAPLQVRPIGLGRNVVRHLQHHALCYIASDGYNRRMSPTHHCSIGRVLGSNRREEWFYILSGVLYILVWPMS